MAGQFAFGFEEEVRDTVESVDAGTNKHRRSERRGKASGI
jgi:hypothetical protein